MPGQAFTAKRCTQICNRRRKQICIDLSNAPLYPHFNVGRARTQSSKCKFITPPAFKPKSNIETGMQGVCKNDSMQNCFRLPLQMLFYTLRTLALRLAQHCKLHSMQNCSPLRLEICVHLLVLNAPPATQLLLNRPPYVYNAEP